ncbi:hypothetical protein PsorP6_004304 [Peronosclerospora sorghi]|uniref:Uncharacterized protein n=1 Tax=Peronosclerospora sorghi TaxID=230839 RepID=A0ACC0VMP3_9STRA|nr:hypothetical protein PsorP6_004304 [Peronosclerospora sorghi]
MEGREKQSKDDIVRLITRNTVLESNNTMKEQMNSKSKMRRRKDKSKRIQWWRALKRTKMHWKSMLRKVLAPGELRRVPIKPVVIHLATTWKVVVKVEGVTVDGQVVNPNTDGVFEFQDTVAMKLTEAANWLNLLVVERTKTQLREKQEQEEEARTLEAAPKAFRFKDRVLHQIAAHVDLHVNDLRVAITGLMPGAAAIDGHDDEGQEQDDEDASVVTDPLIPALLKPTSVSLMLKSMDLLTDSLHENPDEALQIFLTSKEILVEHGMRIKGLNICAGVEIMKMAMTMRRP